MTVGEAFAFLNAADKEEAHDAYDLSLFEIKRFFTSKPVLFKTYTGKWDKLALLDEAFSVINEYCLYENASLEINLFESAIIGAHFSQWESNKHRLKTALFAAKTGRSIRLYSEKMLELERWFTQIFQHPDHWTDAPIKIGTEPDPMLIRKLMHENGEKTFEQLRQTENNLSEEVLLFLKRLSLSHAYLYP